MKFSEIPLNYLKFLYRKDNNGNVYVWCASIDLLHCDWYIDVYYGRINGTIIKSTIKTNRDPAKEIDSRINDKRKSGYKYLYEIRDDVQPPVKEALLDWLIAYLPEDRTDSYGTSLSMLAKSFDKCNNLYKNTSNYIGQWKINGLRCSIGAKIASDGLFEEYKLVFHPREGGEWNSLGILEEYLLNAIPKELLNIMIDEGYELDGEVYIPGHTVNEINSAVKNINNPLNKLVQFWCYDIIIPEVAQWNRITYRDTYLYNYVTNFKTKEEHLHNTKKLIVLPNDCIDPNTEMTFRDRYIDLGFEGLIMRNPNEPYQFGKRNMAMIKYKRSTDGKFLILDIYPEGIKRDDIPLFKLKNDINDATFEVHLNGTFEEQKKYLYELKEQTIGKHMFVEFGERSGINQVPFHCKKTFIID